MHGLGEHVTYSVASSISVFILLFYFCLGVTPGCLQRLLLTQNSRITQDHKGSGNYLRMLAIESGLAMAKASTLLDVLLLLLQQILSLIGAGAHKIIFTSDNAEPKNIAVKRVANFSGSQNIIS